MKRTVDVDAQPVVKVVGLHKTFVQSGPWPWSESREVRAVRGVDFTIAPGEVVALVGQSGSGKTTVSRIVLGLEDPTNGEIWLDGERWDDQPESQRRGKRVRYQYVPQDAMGALDPQQTALEHVVETLTVLAGKTPEAAHDEAVSMLDRLGLGQRLHALPREMSGGEQRRVTLARVLALRPKLVVADEPTSGLDPDRRESVLQDLIGNLPEDAGCILVTHDMSEARAWCHRIFAMLAGRVIEEVDLRQDAPVHPYASVLFDPWSGPLPTQPLATEGCPFRPDCPRASEADGDVCARDEPALSPADPRQHRVACHVVEAT
mgnify:CR=1 FL=1